MDYYYYYYFCFAKTGREVLFKTGQPKDEELLSLAREIKSIWRPLGVVLGLTNATLDEIHEYNPKVLDKSYTMLRKWKESRGSGASYQNLAEGLDNEVFKRHDLVERYCNDKGK